MKTLVAIITLALGMYYLAASALASWMVSDCGAVATTALANMCK